MIFLVWYLYFSKWIVVDKRAILRIAYQVAVFLYTDDIDITVMNSDSESVEEIVACTQLLLDV